MDRTPTTLTPAEPQHPRPPAARTAAIGAGAVLLLATVIWATTGGGDKPDHDTAHWLTQGGQAAITQISTDLKAMGAATNPSAMGEACAAFKTNLKAAQGLGPIPDPEAQRNWSTAVTAALGGADACMGTNSATVDSVRQEFLTRMEDDLTEADVAFSKVRARLLELARTAG